MKTVGQKLDPFRVTGVKPGFNQHEENGVSAFEEITEKSFPGKWKVIYFYPKDFTFVCPTEIVGFAGLAADFEDRDAVLLAGSTDNEFVKLAWRRDHKDLDRLNHWMFADTTGALVDMLGIRDDEGGRGAAGDLHRRPGKRRPARLSQQPERRPQPGGSAARARWSADRRAVPMQSRGGSGDAEYGDDNGALDRERRVADAQTRNGPGGRRRPLHR